MDHAETDLTKFESSETIQYECFPKEIWALMSSLSLGLSGVGLMVFVISSTNALFALALLVFLSGMYALYGAIKIWIARKIPVAILFETYMIFRSPKNTIEKIDYEAILKIEIWRDYGRHGLVFSMMNGQDKMFNAGTSVDLNGIFRAIKKVANNLHQPYSTVMLLKST